MDTAVAKAFIMSAQTTFKEMFGMAAEAQAPKELAANEDHGWDVTGLVGIAGQGQGVVAVRLTHELLSRLLAGSGVVAGSDGERRELEGGLVGELINIIAGHAISAIKGVNLDIAPPVVVRGPNHKIGWPGIATVLQLPFKLAEGSFEVDLCLKL
jgi:chemotaxis protein CheX